MYVDRSAASNSEGLEMQVVPDEQIEAWQNEEKALHKYCGHAWHLETAVSRRSREGLQLNLCVYADCSERGGTTVCGVDASW